MILNKKLEARRDRVVRTMIIKANLVKLRARVSLMVVELRTSKVVKAPRLELHDENLLGDSHHLREHE